MKEIGIGGIYVSPLAGQLAVAFLIYLAVRRFWLRDIEGKVWHPPLFRLSVFVIILAFLSLLF